MACCSKARKKALAQKAPLPGADGFKLFEYGGVEPVELVSRTTEVAYRFTPGAQVYIDVWDVGMLLLYRENGGDKQVFFEVAE